MKKLLFVLLALCLLFGASALAESDADDYITAGPWHMNVSGWGFDYYMAYFDDGTGIMAVPYVACDGAHRNHIYSFNWQTFMDGTSYYINIFFEGEFTDSRYGWGCAHAPHKYNTYFMLWNPERMYLFDLTHTGTDARGFDASKGMNLTRVDEIPGISTNPYGGSGAFGGGSGGGR